MLISRDVTEQQRAAGDVRRLATLVESAHDAIYTRTVGGVILTWNAGAERLYGYTAAEMIGGSCLVVVPPDCRGELEEKHARLLREEPVEPFETRRLRKDGQTVFVSVSLAAINDEMGQVVAIASIGRDVTDRRLAEEALRREHEFSQSLVDTARTIVLVLDADGRIVRYNSYLEELTGWRLEEVQGKDWFETFLPKRDRQRIGELFGRARGGERTQGNVNPIVTKDGRERVIEWFDAPLPLAQGELIGLLCIGQDITDRKRIEEALRSSHVRLAADLAVMAKLQELSNQLVRDDNPEGLLPSVLDAAIAINSADMGKIQLLDCDSGELRIVASRGFEPSFLEFFHAVSQRHAACGITMQNRERVVIEDITKSPVFAGTPALDVMLAAGVRAVQSTPLVSRSGQLVGMLSMHYRKPHVSTEKDLQVIDLLARQAADWIERTEAQEELRRNHDGLKILVTELQAKNEEIRATTQQLWQAAKLASVGELAASIVHELNNPLATMSLRIESLLEDASQEDPNRRALEIIQQETRRMSTLVANLLQFSRRGHEQISTVDIRQELNSTIELVDHHLKKRQIAIVQELAPDTPLIYADRQKLRQVFLNLFTNASDAMPQGGTLTLRSRAETLADGKAAVRMEVADTGIGIRPDHLNNVFDPYFTTKEEGQGTGLGLAICRRIIAEHHGTIQIDSEAGKGSVVIIVLPVRDGKNSDRLRGGPPVTEEQGNVQE